MGGWSRGKGGRLCWLFMFWSAIEIKTKPIIQIQACKFLQNSETGKWNYITSFCFRGWNPDWKAGPNLNSDVQVETDIQRGVVELYYDTLKADSDADSIWIWYDRRVSRNKIISRFFSRSFQFIYYFIGLKLGGEKMSAHSRPKWPRY